MCHRNLKYERHNTSFFAVAKNWKHPSTREWSNCGTFIPWATIEIQKEQMIDTCNNLDRPQGNHTEWKSQPQGLCKYIYTTCIFYIYHIWNIYHIYYIYVCIHIPQLKEIQIFLYLWPQSDKSYFKSTQCLARFGHTITKQHCEIPQQTGCFSSLDLGIYFFHRRNVMNSTLFSQKTCTVHNVSVGSY